MQEQNQEIVHLHNKVSGFENAIVYSRKLQKDVDRGVVVTKRQEEFLKYVENMVFAGGSVNDVVQTPSLYIQNNVVDRWKDLT